MTESYICDRDLLCAAEQTELLRRAGQGPPHLNQSNLNDLNSRPNYAIISYDRHLPSRASSARFLACSSCRARLTCRVTWIKYTYANKGKNFLSSKINNNTGSLNAHWLQKKREKKKNAPNP